MILKKLLSKEAIFIVIVIFIEVGIFWFLKDKIHNKTYQSAQNSSIQADTPEEQKEEAEAMQNPDSLPAKSPQEENAITELESTAKSRNWDEFEMKRKELAQGFVKNQLQPTTGTALYFFPEVLPDGSFEKNFAVYELYPELANLKKAYDSGSKNHIEGAYEVLETRVQNYELGAQTAAEDLSQEAKKFLEIYQGLVKH